MTPQQTMRKRARMYALIGVGIAALYGAYQFAVTAPPEGTPSPVMPLIFVAIGIVCFAIAALMTRKPPAE